jgi:hypothetical protein
MRMPDIPASGPGLQAQGPAGQQAWGWTSCRHIAMERSARQLIHPHIDSLSQPAEAQGTAGRVEQRRVREWAKAQGQRGQKSRGGCRPTGCQVQGRPPTAGLRRSGHLTHADVSKQSWLIWFSDSVYIYVIERDESGQPLVAPSTLNLGSPGGYFCVPDATRRKPACLSSAVLADFAWPGRAVYEVLSVSRTG